MDNIASMLDEKIVVFSYGFSMTMTYSTQLLLSSVESIHIIYVVLRLFLLSSLVKTSTNEESDLSSKNVV